MVGLTILHPIHTVSHIQFQDKLMNAKGLLAFIVSKEGSIHEKHKNQGSRPLMIEMFHLILSNTTSLLVGSLS